MKKRPVSHTQEPCPLAVIFGKLPLQLHLPVVLFTARNVLAHMVQFDWLVHEVQPANDDEHFPHVLPDK